jgi:hypothetical protein
MVERRPIVTLVPPGLQAHHHIHGIHGILSGGDDAATKIQEAERNGSCSRDISSG